MCFIIFGIMLFVFIFILLLFVVVFIVFVVVLIVGLWDRADCLHRSSGLQCAYPGAQAESN